MRGRRLGPKGGTGGCARCIAEANGPAPVGSARDGPGPLCRGPGGRNRGCAQEVVTVQADYFADPNARVGQDPHQQAVALGGIQLLKAIDVAPLPNLGRFLGRERRGAAVRSGTALLPGAPSADTDSPPEGTCARCSGSAVPCPGPSPGQEAQRQGPPTLAASPTRDGPVRLGRPRAETRFGADRRGRTPRSRAPNPWPGTSGGSPRQAA